MTKKKKERKAKRAGTQKHHILPSSRGGSSHHFNICRIDETKHRAYHFLFWNLTPDEIIKELVKNYWKGQLRWVRIALNEMEV